jgi:hypothetical protein
MTVRRKTAAELGYTGLANVPLVAQCEDGATTGPVGAWRGLDKTLGYYTCSPDFMFLFAYLQNLGLADGDPLPDGVHVTFDETNGRAYLRDGDGQLLDVDALPGELTTEA